MTGQRRVPECTVKGVFCIRLRRAPDRAPEKATFSSLVLKMLQFAAQGSWVTGSDIDI